MKFSTFASAALLGATAYAQDVACRFNGQQAEVVDLDTGVCSFSIPSDLPVRFDFKSVDNYDVYAYYLKPSADKYFNDIAAAGRTIAVPARVLFNLGAQTLFQVHLEESNPTNSTDALRRRFNSQLKSRSEETDELVAKVKATDGTALAGSYNFEVSEPDVPGSSTGGEGAASTATATNTETTVITVTSCSDDKCTESTATATKGPTTVTTDGTTSVYTTWCPISTEYATNTHTTLITITSCHDDKCHESTVKATEGPTTVTSDGKETVYTTWCPVTDEATTVTKATQTTVITITSCHDDKCHESTVKATEGPTTVTKNGEVTTYTTWCPVTDEETTKKTTAPATKEGTTTVATVTVCEGGECHETTAPATKGATTLTSAGVTTTYTTWVPVTTAPATGQASTSTKAPASSSPAISTLFNGAGKVGASLALFAVPLAYFI